MKIVVTGGAGFIGSHLVDALVSGEHQVWVVDHHKRDRERYGNDKAQVIKLNVGHTEAHSLLDEIRPDVVVHLAAQISVTRSLKDPIFDAEQNIMQALQFTEAARKAGVQRVIFASSGGAIYGDHPERPTPELFDTKPLSPYGIGKLVFEQFLANYHREHGLSAMSLRFANLYGPRQQIIRPGGEGAVIPAFLERLLVTSEPFVVFGDGSASRDYVYIDDAVDAIVKAVSSDVPFDIMNVATGEEVTINELIKTLFEIHGQEHPLDYQPFRPGEVRHSVLAPHKAKQVLGWAPKVSFKEGLRRTYDWYKVKFGKSV